jgi:hypothetical protein
MVDKTFREIKKIFLNKIYSELLNYCNKDKTITRKEMICVLSYIRIDSKKNIDKIISIMSDLGMLKTINRDNIQIL